MRGQLRDDKRRDSRRYRWLQKRPGSCCPIFSSQSKYGERGRRRKMQIIAVIFSALTPAHAVTLCAWTWYQGFQWGPEARSHQGRSGTAAGSHAGWPDQVLRQAGRTVQLSWGPQTHHSGHRDQRATTTQAAHTQPEAVVPSPRGTSHSRGV